LSDDIISFIGNILVLKSACLTSSALRSITATLKDGGDIAQPGGLGPTREWVAPLL